MEQKHFYKSFCARCVTLLVLALMSTNLAWGEEKSFDITISNFSEISTSYTKTYTHEYTLDGSNVKVEAYGVYKNTNGIQMNSGKGTYIKNTTPIPGYITKIVVNWSATGKNSPTLYVNKGGIASTSSTSLGKGSNTVKQQTYTVTNPSTSQMNYFYFDGTTVTGACYAAITVYYNSGPTKLTTPTGMEVNNVTSTSAALYWEEVEHASDYEVWVTAPQGGYENTFYPTTNSLVVEELTPSTKYTWTVKALGDGTNYEDSEESEMNNFTTPDPPTLRFTVTFNPGTNGTCETESLKESSPGAGVTLPSCTANTGYVFLGWSTQDNPTTADAGDAGNTFKPTSDCTLYAYYGELYSVTLKDTDPATVLSQNTYGGSVELPSRTCVNKEYTFVGWSTKNVAEETETAPTIIPAGAYTPTANIDLYPIFTRTEVGSGFSGYEKVTSAPADWSGQYLLSTGKLTATGAISSNHLTRDNYYDFSKEATSREFTVTKVGDAGYSIKIGNYYLGWSSGTSFTTNTQAPEEASTSYLWTLSTSTISNAKDKSRIIADNGSSDFRPYSNPTDGLVYLYRRIEGSSTTYYTSNPAAIIVKTPAFTPADGTKFASALDVTIACATEDATIQYSIDNGESWSDYSEAINITETTTIQAKAVKETVESSVVEATYTQLAGLLSMKENGAGTYKLTDAVVTYITGNNAFIQDATSGAYLYGCKGELAVGDVINGDVTVATTEYKGLFEISTFNTENATIANDPTKVVPTIVTITDLNANYGRYEGVYVKIEGATVTSAFSSKSATIEQNDASITLYDQFNLSLAADATAVVDVTGFLSKYTDVQFWTKEITVKSAGKKTSTIKFTKANGSYCVDDMEEFAATAYDEEGAPRTDGYTITYTSSDTDIAEVEEGHILAYKEGKVTITASTVATDEFAAAEATFDITILPKGTVWFEDFTGMKTDDVKEKYVVSEGGKADIYKETTAGGTAPEILLNGTLTVDLKGKAEEGVYKLTFNSNNGADLSAEGATVSTAKTDENNEKLWIAYVVVTDPTNFTLSFSRTANSRLDNLLLTFDHAIQSKNVTISSNSFATAYAPYNATVTNAKAYKVTVEDNKATLVELTKTIPANTGVILYGTANATATFTETEGELANVKDNKLVAATEIYTCTEADYGKVFYLGSNDGKAAFKMLAVNGTIAAGKAYLKLKDALTAGAKLEVVFGDEPTGIEGINCIMPMDNQIYNLQGVRVNNIVKGNIYIVNGKKYLAK